MPPSPRTPGSIGATGRDGQGMADLGHCLGRDTSDEAPEPLALDGLERDGARPAA